MRLLESEVAVAWISEAFVVAGKRIIWDIFRGTGKVAWGWGSSGGGWECLTRGQPVSEA